MLRGHVYRGSGCTIIRRTSVGDGPLGQWREEFLGEWLDDVQVAHFEELEIKLHSYASFTTDGIPRLETIDNVSGEIDNSFFCIKLPRPDADFDAFCDQLDLNVIYNVDDFAPWSQHLIDDHCFRFFSCQVGVNNACEPLMLCTILLGCISSILSEINALLIMLNQTKKFSSSNMKGSHLYEEQFATFGSPPGHCPQDSQIYGIQIGRIDEKQLFS